MSDKYCPNCRRMVGVKKNLVPGGITIVVGLVLFFVLPFLGWLLGGLIAIVGIFVLIMGGEKCPMCGSKNLLPTAVPEEKLSSSAPNNNVAGTISYQGEASIPDVTVVATKDTTLKYKLRCISGVVSGTSIPITTSTPVLIGRDPNIANMVINSPDVSRSHAQVSVVKEGNLLLEDKNSSNGTFRVTDRGKERINGVCSIKIGDKFSVGTGDNIFEVCK